MYALLYSDTVEKQLSKLERDQRERILKALERARGNPFHYFIKLTGMDFFRMRVGDYRVMADIHQGKLQILVVKVGKRENVYD